MEVWKKKKKNFPFKKFGAFKRVKTWLHSILCREKIEEKKLNPFTGILLQRLQKFRDVSRIYLYSFYRIGVPMQCKNHSRETSTPGITWAQNFRY